MTKLPPNCPMLKADYEHYCPSKAMGPDTFEKTGKCFKQDECSKVVKDFRKMNIKTSSEMKKVFSL